ncbi:MAG: hypothetical protein ACFFDK_05245 [Promethearchaeota archaeon]
MSENKPEKLNDWIIATIWITFGIIGFGCFLSSVITDKYNLFASILIFNGIGMTFIIIIFILSLIEVFSIEGDFQNGFYSAYLLDLIACAIGAVIIISIFGGHHFTEHIVLEFFYIFFIYCAISGGLSMLIGASTTY